MEIKGKAYFEIYYNDKLMSQGVGEDMKFSGEFRMHYLPSSYKYRPYPESESTLFDYKIPIYVITYYSMESTLDEINSKIELEEVQGLGEVDKVLHMFNEYRKNNKQ